MGSSDDLHRRRGGVGHNGESEIGASHETSRIEKNKWCAEFLKISMVKTRGKKKKEPKNQSEFSLLTASWAIASVLRLIFLIGVTNGPDEAARLIQTPQRPKEK